MGPWIPWPLPILSHIKVLFARDKSASRIRAALLTKISPWIAPRPENAKVVLVSIAPGLDPAMARFTVRACFPHVFATPALP